MEWIRDIGNEVWAGILALILDRVISLIWNRVPPRIPRFTRGIANFVKNRFVVATARLYQRGIQQSRSRCLKRWKEFREMHPVAQAGLGAFVVCSLPVALVPYTQPGEALEAAYDPILATWCIGWLAVLGALTYGMSRLLYRRIKSLIRT